MNDNLSHENEMNTDEEHEIILFHGIDGKRLNTMIDTLKQAGLLTRNTILATTTDQSINWTVKDLIAELNREHAWFRNQAKEKEKPSVDTMPDKTRED